MKTMERNKRTIWYANYAGKEETLSESGKRTGQFHVQYSEPIELRANVSPAKGSSDNELFGITESYDRTIVTDKMDINLSESSVVWVDAKPDTAWDYVVVRVARSLNSATIAIKKVTAQ